MFTYFTSDPTNENETKYYIFHVHTYLKHSLCCAELWVCWKRKINYQSRPVNYELFK